MTGGRVASIWRFPIKSHGREEITETVLTPGGTMPFDRVWAVAHEESAVDGTDWAPCANFSRIAKAPKLAAMTARTEEASGTVTLSHPDRPEDLTFSPDTDGAALIDWAGDMIPQGRARSARIVRAAARGWTDSPAPTITLANLSSHRAVEQRVGQPLSIHRWRANVWMDGLGPWQEFEWLDRDIRIGGAVLRVIARTDRCLATHANPETGTRDVDILKALEHWGHVDFSVLAEVIEGGPIGAGDEVLLG